MALVERNRCLAARIDADLDAPQSQPAIRKVENRSEQRCFNLGIPVVRMNNQAELGSMAAPRPGQDCQLRHPDKTLAPARQTGFRNQDVCIGPGANHLFPECILGDIRQFC